MRNWAQAARRLRRRPGLVAVTLLSLGLGIGGATTVFGLVDALLLQPLPAQRPEELAAVFTSDFSGERYGGSSYPDYRDLRDRELGFQALAAYAPQPLNLAGPERAELIVGETVSGNYFDTLGVAAAVGRSLRPADDMAGAEPVTVLSHGLWRRRFGADPGLVGRTVELSGLRLTVVGVAPASFPGLVRGLRIDAWVPFQVRERLRPGALEARGERGLYLIGRLRPGTSLPQAQARLDGSAAELARAHPVQWLDRFGKPRRLSALPESRARLDPRLAPALAGFTGLLGGVTLVVLLAACANLAGLLLAHLSSRRRELAVRVSLGATRARLLRELLCEALLLAGLGGAAGVLLAGAALGAVSAYRPPLPVPLLLDLGLHARVLLFALGLALVTALLVGLLPALSATRAEAVEGLRGGGTSTHGRARSRLRSAFVVAQVALALVLLLGGGLLLRGLARAAAIDPGFACRSGVLASLDLSLGGYGEPAGRAFLERAAARVARVPGVERVAWATSAPLSLDFMRRGVWVEGRPETPGEDHEEAFSVVGPGYVETLGIALLGGRSFDARDRAGAPGVAIVNQTFARRYWPGQEALGRRLGVSGPEGPFLEVVGVLRDGRYFTLGEAPRPYFLLPLEQNFETALTLIARTTREDEPLVAAVARALESEDRALPLFGARTLGEHLALAQLPTRLAGAVLGACGLLALGLACLGVFGVVAYAVGERTPEIGVRLALGAQPGQVLRLVLGQALRLVGLGMALGLGLALLGAQALAALLYGLPPTDPSTFLGVAAAFALTALMAGYLPARRAARVDPIATLRQE